MDVRLLTTKLIGAFIVLVIGFVCSAILPLYMAKDKATISNAQAFSGGIFLAISFLHMLPEASDTLEHSGRTFYIPDPEDGGSKPFPLSTFCLSCVAIFILFLEKVLICIDDIDDLLGRNSSESKECHITCCDETNRISPVIQRCVETMKISPVATVESAFEVIDKDKPCYVKSCENAPVGTRKYEVIKNERPIAYVLLLVLCIHSILAGMSTGLADTFQSTLLILIAIVSHKGFAGFALGCDFVKAGLERPFHIKLAVVFSLATPLGIVIGTITHGVLESTSTLQWVDGIFGAIGAGVFVYLAMMIMFGEFFKGDRTHRVRSFLWVLAGFALMLTPAVFA